MPRADRKPAKLRGPALDAACLDMRAQGHGYDGIAIALGVETRTVVEAVRRGHERLRQGIGDRKTIERDMMLARFDRATRALAPAVEKGSTAAIQVQVMIDAQRSRLLGLDEKEPPREELRFYRRDEIFSELQRRCQERGYLEIPEGPEPPARVIEPPARAERHVEPDHEHEHEPPAERRAPRDRGMTAAELRAAYDREHLTTVDDARPYGGRRVDPPKKPRHPLSQLD